MIIIHSLFLIGYFWEVYKINFITKGHKKFPERRINDKIIKAENYFD